MFEIKVQVPEAGSDKPTLWAIDEYSTEIVHFTRDSVRRLARSWVKHHGIYVLLSDVDASGEFQVYAGSAYAAGIRSRVPGQVNRNSWSTNGFALRRQTLSGYSDSQAFHLESLMFDIAGATPWCDRVNAHRPAQGQVSVAERRWLRQSLEPLLAVLAQHGYRFNSAAVSAQRSGAVTLRDLLHAGLLHPGDVLHPRWKPDGIAPATVTATGDILWEGVVYDGTQPSIPARLARGLRRTNAWQYYTVVREDGEAIHLEDLRHTFREHTQAA